MSHVDLGLVGSAQAKVAGTTLTVTNSSGATIPAGALLVLGVVSDNPASVTAPTISFTSNGTGGTWTQLGSTTGSGVTTTAGAGIWQYVYYVYTANTIANGATISVVNLSVSTVAKAAVIEGYTNLYGTPYGVAQGTSTAGTPTATTAVSVTAGDCCIGVIAAENTTITADTDTLNGTWDGVVSLGTSGSTAATNAIVGIQDKDVSVTSAQTFNATSSNDAIVTVFAVPGPTVKTASDTCAITITATTSFDTLADVRKAIANRETKRVDIGILGASIAEGYLNTIDKTIESYLANILRTEYVTSGNPAGRGYIGHPSVPVYGVGTWRTAYTGAGTVDETAGWGGKHSTWYTAGGTNGVVYFYPDTPASSFDMNIIQTAGGSVTGGLYYVDGGAGVQYSTFNATDRELKVHINTPVTSWVAFAADPSLAGTAYAIVNGVTFYSGDENKGIMVHNFGHASYTVDNWMRNDIPPINWVADIVGEGLDLLVLSDFGINDGASTIGNISAATFKTKYASLISYIRSNGYTGPILNVAGYNVSSAVTFVDPWSSYVTAISDVAQSTGTAFLQLDRYMPATPGPLYYSDGLHGATDGSAYNQIATLIANTIDGSMSSMENPAITITESSSVLVSISSTDSCAITITDASSVSGGSSASKSAVESEALTFTESRSIAGSSTSTESEAVTITEGTSQIAGSSTSVESEALTITEGASQVAGSSTSVDSCAITITETSSVVITAAVAASESEAVTITEARTLSGSSTSTESEAVTITESRTLAGSSTSTESEALTITEGTSQVSGSSTSVDTGAITIADVSSLTILNVLSASESEAITIAESRTLAGSSTSTESEAVTITESRTLAGSSTSTESEAISIADVSSVLVTNPRTDSCAITITESSSVVILVSRTDTAAITIADSSAVTRPLSAVDSTAISIADTSSNVATVIGLTIHVRVAGAWVAGRMYKRVGGAWVHITPQFRDTGVWR